MGPLNLPSSQPQGRSFLDKAALFAGNPLVGLGINVLGGKLLGGKPEVPKFTAESLNAGREAQRRLDRQSKRAMELAEADAAAGGVTGSGAGAMREGLYRANQDASADLSGQIADDVARARNREAQFRYGAETQTYENRARGLSGFTQSLVQNRLLDQYLGKQDPDGMTGEDGEPGVPGAIALGGSALGSSVPQRAALPQASVSPGFRPPIPLDPYRTPEMFLRSPQRF